MAGDVDAAIEYIIAEKESADLICIEENSFSDTNGIELKWTYAFFHHATIVLELFVMLSDFFFDI